MIKIRKEPLADLLQTLKNIHISTDNIDAEQVNSFTQKKANAVLYHSETVHIYRSTDSP